MKYLLLGATAIVFLFVASSRHELYLYFPLVVMGSGLVGWLCARASSLDQDVKILRRRSEMWSEIREREIKHQTAAPMSRAMPLYGDTQGKLNKERHDRP